MTTAVNPRSLGIESEWLDVPDADIYELARSAGYGSAKARGLVGWVALKRAMVPDDSGAPTRAEYRKMLEAMGSAPTKTSPRQRRRRDRGASTFGASTMTASLAAAGAMATAGNNGLALVAGLPALVYITRIMGGRAETTGSGQEPPTHSRQSTAPVAERLRVHAGTRRHQTHRRQSTAPVAERLRVLRRHLLPTAEYVT